MKRRRRKLLSEMGELERCKALEKAYQTFEKKKQEGWGDTPFDLSTCRPVTEGRMVTGEKHGSDAGLPCPFVLCEGTLQEADKGKCVCDTCHRIAPTMSASKRALTIVGPTLRMFAALDEEMGV
ncbi:hypothetical protein HZB90_02775 [archaeon]|nr:hypothetical protein [archaeon]